MEAKSMNGTSSVTRVTASSATTAVSSAAARLARWGGRVLPLWPAGEGTCTCPAGAECGSPGKHPVASLVPHGLHDASADCDVVSRWWARMPMANVGLATGPVSGTGIMVIDVDPRNGGDESMRHLVAKHGRLPRTVTAATGGGGWHLLFRLESGVRGKLAPGVDVKAAGGYIVAPPSIHASGRHYRWLCRQAPWEIPVADAPPWLTEILCTPAVPEPVQMAAGGGQPLDVVNRARRYVAKCLPAISGRGGHTSTFAVAQALVRGFELSEAQALEILLAEYNPRCLPPWSARELRHKVRQAASRGHMPPGSILCSDPPYTERRHGAR